MTDSNNSPIEQLWYTWSDIGVSTIHAGFHIRAASPGLTEIYGERVRSMERYMRYTLPAGTNARDLTPAMAPVGLTFTRSEWNNEYILVHKNYLGKDGVGRSGNFFVHVLALGENSDFSTEDAIWLWGSDIWKTTDQGLDRRITRLDHLSIQDIEKTTNHFRPEQFRQVQDALQFVIAAYLMRKNRTNPIYIAAPANQASNIASIIAGLTNCLPAQLLAGLTFSTYEPDITKATTEIVGTSWIPISGQEAALIFPTGWYRDRLAINCETREKSNLQGHPQIIYDPLAADFAAYAAECLAAGTVELLYSLREYVDTSNSLDIALFLQLYHNQIVNTGSMDEIWIEKYLNSDLCTNWLSQKSSRKKVIDRVIANLPWSTGSLYNILLALRERAERESAIAAQTTQAEIANIPAASIDPDRVASVPSPEVEPGKEKNKGSLKKRRSRPATLTDALALLARNMIPETVRRMEQAISANSTERRRLLDEIMVLLRLMDACILPQDPREVWKQLFGAIEGSTQAISFLRSEWPIHSWLLKVWHNTFLPNSQDDDRMRPLLLIPWSRLDDFLRLGLQNRHPQWVAFLVQELVTDPATLTPQIVKELEHSREIEALLTMLAQNRYPIEETSLIIRLIEKGYPINSTLEQHIEPLLEVLNRANHLQRTAKDLVVALIRAGYTVTDRYERHVIALVRNLLTTAPQAGHELVVILIQYDFPRSWLVDLLVKGSGSDLLAIIQYIYPKPEDQNRFFLQEGSRYLRHEEYVQSMLALYQRLLPIAGRLERLFILLDAISDQAKILSLLKLTTPLDTHEWEAILRRYGKRYLQLPELAAMIISIFAAFIDAGSSNDLLFSILPEQAADHDLEQLLTAAKLTPQQQARFLEEYGTSYISRYPKMPVLAGYISAYIANFNTDSLMRSETKAFFAFLLLNYKNLALDADTTSKIENWRIINSYFNAPDLRSQTLQALANALSSLKLQDDAQFTARLARILILCIRTSSDIAEIMKYLQETLTPGESKKHQFLYTLAEEAAKQAVSAGSSRIRISGFVPYIVFVLTMPQGEAQFFHLFMDKLLSPLVKQERQDRNTWTYLDDLIAAQGLDATAMQRWRAYLRSINVVPDKVAQSSPTAKQAPVQGKDTPWRKLTKRLWGDI